jgi:threonine dehydratase
MGAETVTFRNILDADRRIKDIVTRTPTYHSMTFSKTVGAEVFMKLECFQPVGVFKIRGAANKICSLSPTELKKGLICASSGNHGLAVSYVSQLCGASATIIVPTNAVEEKVRAIRNYGAKVIEFGNDYDEAHAKALEVQGETGATFVHPFNDVRVVAGQGTVGLELLREIPDLDAIIVPIGGGGLISGISVAAKNISPNIRIIGVQPEGASAVYQSWKAGEIVELNSIRTAADGLAARKPLELTFELIKKHVDNILLVTEREIGEAVLAFLNQAHILAEPSGAASLAALFKYQPTPKEKIAIIVSGANISVDYLTALLNSRTPEPT